MQSGLSRVMPLLLACACACTASRGTWLQDGRGQLALLTGEGSRHAPWTVPTSLLVLPDGELALTGFSDRGGHLLGARLSEGTFVIRLRPDGRLRWVRSLPSRFAEEDRPLLLPGGPEGGLLLLGRFQGEPVAPGASAHPWPLLLRAMHLLSEDGSRVWTQVLETVQTTGSTYRLAAVAVSPDRIVVGRFHDTYLLEERSLATGLASGGLRLLKEGGAVPRVELGWVRYLAGSDHERAYAIAGRADPGMFLHPFDDSLPREGAREPVPLPVGSFLARIESRSRTVHWVVPLTSAWPLAVITARAEGTLLVGDAHSVQAHDARDGRVLWARPFECSAGQVVGLARDPTRDSVVVAFLQDGIGNCEHGSVKVTTRNSPPLSDALVFHRVSLRDGHTEAVALLRTDDDPQGRESSILSFSEVQVDGEGEVLALGDFSGRLRMCVPGPTAFRRGCRSALAKERAFFVARVPWEPSPGP